MIFLYLFVRYVNFCIENKNVFNRYFRDGNQYVIKQKQALCFFRKPYRSNFTNSYI